VAEFGRLENARLWRRKFLYIHGTQRPPYYGSWSRMRCTQARKYSWHLLSFTWISAPRLTINQGTCCPSHACQSCMFHWQLCTCNQ
jgi:hypothetical protein